MIKRDQNLNKTFTEYSGEFRSMSMVKCALCKKEENSLIRVKHKEFGIVKLCFECWAIEYGNQNLLPSCAGGCDCCRF